MTPLKQTILDRLDAHQREAAEEQAKKAAQGPRKGRPPNAPPTNWDYLVLAAMEGPQEGARQIDEVLGNKNLPPRTPNAPTAQANQGKQPEPPGTYIKTIAVEGFRGIGPRAVLDLTPGPGLTLVVGRNGSGKSSFAEGLELLLTGTSYRWEERGAQWKDGWRCLHHPKTALEAELILDGQSGLAKVSSTWKDGDELDAGETTIQPRGAKRVKLKDHGDWETALGTYRPFLSYSELGGMLDGKPSDLHDALNKLLGLDELDTAQQTLKDAREAREKAGKAATRQGQELRQKLAALTDERARKANEALDHKEGPDFDELERLLAGSAATPDQESALALLQRLSTLESTAPNVATMMAADLREAHAALAKTAGTLGERSHDIAELLDKALHFQQKHDAKDCPVCGRKDALGPEWRTTSETDLANLRDAARFASDAKTKADETRGRAQRLAYPQLELLDRAADVGLDARETIETARAFRDAIATNDLLALADGLERTTRPLADALATLRNAASTELQQREDAWLPVAREIGKWLPTARDASHADDAVASLKRAEKWLKETAVDLRNERFTPIKEQAQEVWEGLRLQSNVSLRDVRLTGTSTQRRVQLDVAVDGKEGTALGVMSQGELHALALSLFIPRATRPESPFRFMVVDDPVQSMDPARVDGLARVLEKAAKKRQVLVFTHDDRLPESIRRLGLEATVIEVTRRENSVVEPRLSKDPVSRYFDDAMTVALTTGLPVAAARRVVPGLCRHAIEAACMEVIRKRRLSRGERHADVEHLLEKQQGTKALMSLALFDDPTRSKDVLPSLDKAKRDYANTFRLVNEGAHELQPGVMRDTVEAAKKLAAWVRTKN